MKQYESMQLVIVYRKGGDIITTSGDNEKTTEASDFLS